MTSSRKWSPSGGNSKTEFPLFPLSPVLELFGFEELVPDHGWYDIKCAFHGDSNESGRVRTTIGEDEVFHCMASYSCPSGNAVQILMQKEGLAFSAAVRRAEEVTGHSNGSVRGKSGGRTSVPRKSGDHGSYRAFKRTWLGQGSDS